MAAQDLARLARTGTRSARTSAGSDGTASPRRRHHSSQQTMAARGAFQVLAAELPTLARASRRARRRQLRRAAGALRRPRPHAEGDHVGLADARVAQLVTVVVDRTVGRTVVGALDSCPPGLRGITGSRHVARSTRALARSRARFGDLRGIMAHYPARLYMLTSASRACAAGDTQAPTSIRLGALLTTTARWLPGRAQGRCILADVEA